jgi:hypothetical protein
MSKVFELSEISTLVPTSKHQFGKWPFENFNIVQSSIFETVEKDCNCLIAASTSAGKTVISEMYGSYEIRKNKKKFLFLCPLRALANEKFYDWTDSNHHFADLKIGIFTGDYKKDNKQNEFDKFDVIIMTSEMLNHKLRTSKKNQDWVKDIGVCVVDESHLLTVEGRGDHLEAALINFSKINPECRMIFLSATLPNVHEIAEWISVSLNQKDTYIIKSKYRPCILNIHTKTYDDQSGIRASIYEMIDEACELVLRHFSDKFLIFVHAKKIGETFIEELKRKNIKAEFHNANLDKDQRQKLENKFKSDKDFRVLIATSTLAWGVNLPARRVIIAGVTRGNEVVASYDILQMVGRAGRPAFDPQGDAYILLPANRRTELEKVVLTPHNIESRMLSVSLLATYDTLAFHIVYEIYVENVKTIDDVKTWYSKTLAAFQGKKLSESILEKTISRLIMLGIIGVDDKTQDFFIKGLGKVSALFYANPYDVSNWSSNFSKLFQNPQIYDLDLSLALANTSSNLVGNLSKEDKKDMEKFLQAVSKRTTKQYPENVIKVAYLYYKIMNGRYEMRHISIYNNIKKDFPRVAEILKGIDSIAKGWNQKQFFDVLQKRMQYGVPAKFVDLIEVKGIGKVKAEKLFDNGFKNKKEVLQNLDAASKVCGLKPETLKKYLDS